MKAIAIDRRPSELLNVNRIIQVSEQYAACKLQHVTRKDKLYIYLPRLEVEISPIRVCNTHARNSEMRPELRTIVRIVGNCYEYRRAEIKENRQLPLKTKSRINVRPDNVAGNMKRHRNKEDCAHAPARCTSVRLITKSICVRSARSIAGLHL